MKTVAEIEIDDLVVTLRNATYGLEALKALIDAIECASASALTTHDTEVKALIDAIEAKLDVPGNFKADVSGLATAAALTVVDNEVAAIEAKLDVPDNFKADVSALATATAVANIPNKDSAPHIQTYPKLAPAVIVTTGVAAWAEGAWTEIIPANTVTEAFWILGVFWIPMLYEGLLEIATGASGSESEIANVPSHHMYLTAHGFCSVRPLSFPSSIKVSANARISARVADLHNVANTHKVKVIYATGL